MYGQATRMKRVALPFAAALALCAAQADAADLTAQQQLFRSIYQELVEINTTDWRATPPWRRRPCSSACSTPASRPPRWR
jgi:hypothetical protein